jgi:hypothetical protein
MALTFRVSDKALLLKDNITGNEVLLVDNGSRYKSLKLSEYKSYLVDNFSSETQNELDYLINNYDSTLRDQLTYLVDNFFDTDLLDQVDDKANKLVLEATEKTADYTLAIGDEDLIIPMNPTAAANLIVPEDATANFPIGTIIGAINISEFDITVSGESESVTVRNSGTVGQNGEVSIRKRAAND